MRKVVRFREHCLKNIPSIFEAIHSPLCDRCTGSLCDGRVLSECERCNTTFVNGTLGSNYA